MTIALTLTGVGVVNDYPELVSRVGEWMNRDDLEDQIPDFVSLFEARFNRLVRAREVTTLWAVTDGVYSLPSDFRRLRKLAVDGSPDTQLVQVSPEDAVKLYGGATGTPAAYSVEGDADGARTLYLYPVGSASLRVTYFSKLPNLSVAAPTNWLMDDHNDIYLWGTLYQAATYIRDPDAIQVTGDYLERAIAELNTMLRNDKWGTPLAPRCAVQVSGARC